MDFVLCDICIFFMFVCLFDLQHIEKLFKHKELELQLVEAKLAQANVQRTEEQERYIKEKQQVNEWHVDHGTLMSI